MRGHLGRVVTDVAGMIGVRVEEMWGNGQAEVIKMRWSESDH